MTTLSTEHTDVVQHICYDFYGKRLATSSIDQKIMIFDQTENGEWQKTATIEKHSGPVLKIDWAHPEFGQILASCSTDRQVCIWEEQESKNGRNWVEVASLRDFRRAVVDVKFAPRHWGLKLAAACEDGHVRVYEAPDVMNLSLFNQQGDFEAERCEVSCVSWNPCRFDASMWMVTGAKNGAVRIWENKRRWAGLLTLCEGVDLSSHSMTQENFQVNDVSWAPNVGRKFHLIAAAIGRRVAVWKFEKVAQSEDRYQAVELSGDDRNNFKMPNINSQVWKVEWNVTGTALAASFDTGKVCLWRSNLQGTWSNDPVLMDETE